MFEVTPKIWPSDTGFQCGVLISVYGHPGQRVSKLALSLHLCTQHLHRSKVQTQATILIRLKSMLTHPALKRVENLTITILVDNSIEWQALSYPSRQNR